MVDRNGTHVTVESPTGARYTKNTSHIKPIELSLYSSSSTTDNVLDFTDSHVPVVTPDKPPDVLDESHRPGLSPSDQVSRPSRTCGMPMYLEDYVRF